MGSVVTMLFVEYNMLGGTDVELVSLRSQDEL